MVPNSAKKRPSPSIKSYQEAADASLTSETKVLMVVDDGFQVYFKLHVYYNLRKRNTSLLHLVLVLISETIIPIILELMVAARE